MAVGFEAPEDSFFASLRWSRAGFASRLLLDGPHPMVHLHTPEPSRPDVCCRTRNRFVNAWLTGVCATCTTESSGRLSAQQHRLQGVRQRVGMATNKSTFTARDFARALGKNESECPNELRQAGKDHILRCESQAASQGNRSMETTVVETTDGRYKDVECSNALLVLAWLLCAAVSLPRLFPQFSTGVL